LDQTLFNGWRETAGAQVAVSPKIQMVEYSQPMGLTKSEAKLTKDGLHICWWSPRHVLFLLKKEKNNSSHLLQHDKSNQDAIFELFKPLQLVPALHPTGNNEFWYCSRSRFMHNSSKATGSNQNILEMKKHDGRPITMSIPVPKGLRE
jgi:hypothetical protein